VLVGYFNAARNVLPTGRGATPTDRDGRILVG